MLSIKNVDTYYGEVQALHNVSLEIQKDEIIAIIGSNGAGKTTLMKSIMGLVKPRHGTIEFCGERLDGLSGWDVVKKGVIYAFVLENGRIVQSGESGELISSPEIKKAYLGG